MKCPLRRKALANSDGGFNNTFLFCLKEECAWWNKVQEECNLVTLAAELFNISGFLNDIRNKMP